MHGLILDTSSIRSFLLLTSQGQVKFFIELPGGEELSKNLGQHVQNALNQNPSFHADFVAVGTGPGSFTGIRVGVAIAKALAFGWKVPLIPFCSLEAFTPLSHESFLIVRKARGEKYYCLCGERSENKVHFQEPFLGLIPIRNERALEIVDTENGSEINAEFLAKECEQRLQTRGMDPLSLLPIHYIHTT